MTKQYTPRDLRQACSMPREDAVWFMEHCADAWEADIVLLNSRIVANMDEVGRLRQRLEAAEEIQERFDRLEDILFGKITRGGK